MVSSGSEKKSGNGLQTMPTVKKGKKKAKKKSTKKFSLIKSKDLAQILIETPV